MINPVPVYKYVKANPLIKLNVNDRVYVVNGFTFLSNQYGVTRKDCLRDINFEDLAKIGLFEKTITNFNISNYSKGDLIVLSDNKDKAREVSASNPTKNRVVEITKEPTVVIPRKGYGKAPLRFIQEMEVKDVNSGKMEIVNTDDVVSDTRKYWFLNSKGQVSCTYYWMNPVADLYRSKTNNIYYSNKDAVSVLQTIEYNINNDAAVLSGGDTMLGKAMMVDNLVEKYMLYGRNSMYDNWCCNSCICKLCSTRKVPGKIYLRILFYLCNDLCNIKI